MGRCKYKNEERVKGKSGKERSKYKKVERDIGQSGKKERSK